MRTKREELDRLMRSDSVGRQGSAEELARFWTRHGRYREAMEAWDREHTRATARGQRGLSPEQKLERARAHDRAGDPAAGDLYRQLTDEPRAAVPPAGVVPRQWDGGVLTACADYALRSGSFDEAVAILEYAASPDNYGSLLELSEREAARARESAPVFRRQLSEMFLRVDRASVARVRYGGPNPTDKDGRLMDAILEKIRTNHEQDDVAIYRQERPSTPDVDIEAAELDLHTARKVYGHSRFSLRPPVVVVGGKRLSSTDALIKAAEILADNGRQRVALTLLGEVDTADSLLAQSKIHAVLFDRVNAERAYEKARQRLSSEDPQRVAQMGPFTWQTPPLRDVSTEPLDLDGPPDIGTPAHRPGPEPDDLSEGGAVVRPSAQGIHVDGATTQRSDDLGSGGDSDVRNMALGNSETAEFGNVKPSSRRHPPRRSAADALKLVTTRGGAQASSPPSILVGMSADHRCATASSETEVVDTSDEQRRDRVTPDVVTRQASSGEPALDSL